MLRSTLIFMFLGSSILTGCATLTKSQVQAVNDFASLASQGAEYPEKVLNKVINSRYDSRVLLASQNVASDAPLTYSALTGLYQAKQKELVPVRRIKKSIAVISDYALALQNLSSPDFAENAGASADALGKSVDNVTTRLNTTLPNTSISPVGSALSKTLKEATGRYIGYKQTKAIKQFVQQGDSLVGALLGSAESLLQNQATIFIQNARQDDSVNVDNLFRSIRSDAPYERYQLAVSSFERINKINQLIELNQQAIQALQQIRLAHKELKDKLLVKQKLLDIGKELGSLYESVNDLQTTYREIDK